MFSNNNYQNQVAWIRQARQVESHGSEVWFYIRGSFSKEATWFRRTL